MPEPADATIAVQDLETLSDGAEGFGGKAAGLARLIAAGANVPTGFALRATTQEPDGWAVADRTEFAARADRLCRRGPVAVRSSALGEDSAERSFAGMFETVLGVVDKEATLAAAARCIASGGSERVLAYSGQHSPLAVGIVVQSLVEPRAAGVCFTRDPAGRDGAVVIEAVCGMGDALVSGRVQPESWRAYRSGLGHWICGVERSIGAIADAECATIAAEAVRLAAKIGYPLDLEWALDRENALWWLQARPITAIVEPPTLVIQRAFDDVDDGPVSVWSNWNVRETLPDPMTPLTRTLWRDNIIPMLGSQILGIGRTSPLMRQLVGLDWINGRLYFNMNAMMAMPLLGRIDRLVSIMDSRNGEVLAVLRKEGVLTRRRLSGGRARVAAGMFVASIRTAFRFSRALSPRRALRALDAEGSAVGRRPDVAGLANDELVAELALWDAPECRRLRDGLQMEGLAVFIYMAAAYAFRKHPRALQCLTTGIAANPTTQISLGIEELVEAAHPIKEIFLETPGTTELLHRLSADDTGPQTLEWLGRLQTFLERVGHRGPMEFDFAAERWAENPTMILELVRSGLRNPERERLVDRIDRLAVERQREIDAAVAASAVWRRPVLRALARLVELYMPLREAPKHYGIFVFQRIRNAAQELGRRLGAADVLDSADDVFFLELSELLNLAEGKRSEQDYRGIVAERRALHEQFRTARPPDFVRSDGVPVVEEALEAGASVDGVLKGTAISAGVATGPVCVLSEPDPLLVRDGDVLVLEFADPGWTPLFARASAVVMEVGGFMCHAAVVAREMGLPAVFGIRGVTRLLVPGETVVVDGTVGIVTSCAASGEPHPQEEA